MLFSDRLVLRVWELMGDDVIDRLGRGEDDRLTLLSVARALANFAANGKPKRMQTIRALILTFVSYPQRKLHTKLLDHR